MRISVNEKPADDEAYIAEIDNPLSENLSNLFLITHDVLEAGKIVREFILKEKPLQKGFEIEDSGIWNADFAETNKSIGINNYMMNSCLWESALIKYARCFSQGRRSKLKGENIFLEEEKLIAHKFFINLRDKHIAHSVSVLEMGKVGIKISPIAEQEKKLLGIVLGRCTRYLESEKTLCTFINICNEVLDHLEEKINIERTKLIEECFVNQTIEDLYKLPYLSFEIPETNPKKVRKQIITPK